VRNEGGVEWMNTQSISNIVHAQAVLGSKSDTLLNAIEEGEREGGLGRGEGEVAL
jgi:hypothetical protein